MTTNKTAKNDVTGDKIATKVTSDLFRNGWDLIDFKKKKSNDLTIPKNDGGILESTDNNFGGDK